MDSAALSASKDKVLFTPGPLTTSRTVKQAMLRDLGARDDTFLAVVGEIRERLLRIAGVSPALFDIVLLQGSGSYGVEAVLGGALPRAGKVLIINNGAYGARMVRMCKVAGIAHSALTYAENQPAKPEEIAVALMDDTEITHVAAVHLETTSGLVNPIEEIGEIAFRFQKQYIVDAMASFGGMAIDIERCHIDWLISSANKCLEGVPGFTFVLARLACLEKCAGYARSLSLDLYDQWEYYRRVGQFRFTPPVQALLAFHQALVELDAEGGVEARAARYGANYRGLIDAMRSMGFSEYVAPANQGTIITTFRYPEDPAFDFDVFYRHLSRRGFDIYSGKVAEGACFRIGNIGRIFPEDVENLMAIIRESLEKMGVSVPVKGAIA